MKKQAYMIATVITLITIVGLSSAKAQTGNTESTANIPFAFNVGDKTFPAGEYTVRCPVLASGLKVLQLSSKDGSASTLVHTSSIAGKTQGSARLVFNQYDQRYYFAEAWLTADNKGMQAPMSRGERATAKEFAAIKRATEMVALALQR